MAAATLRGCSDGWLGPSCRLARPGRRLVDLDELRRRIHRVGAERHRFTSHARNMRDLRSSLERVPKKWGDGSLVGSLRCTPLDRHRERIHAKRTGMVGVDPVGRGRVHAVQCKGRGATGGRVEPVLRASGRDRCGSRGLCERSPRTSDADLMVTKAVRLARHSRRPRSGVS